MTTNYGKSLQHAPRNGSFEPSDDDRSHWADGCGPGMSLDEMYDTQVENPVEKFSYASLTTTYPKLRPALIEGIARECESINLVSQSKEGKTWMTEGLAFDFVTGQPWLGTFQAAGASCLLLDFELHRETLSHRLRTIAKAKSLTKDMIGDKLEVWPLRGSRKSIYSLREDLKAAAGRFKLVIIDAKYRATGDANENDNALQTMFYNEIDYLAEMMQAAFLMVLHGSKGNQSDKSITDIGAGAGSQSRAVDSHLVLRTHEEDGCAVLEGKVRSFAPIEPLGVRWQFPLWLPETDIDTAALKGKGGPGAERQGDMNREADDAVIDACQTWQSLKQIESDSGMGRKRIVKAVKRLRERRLLDEDDQIHEGNQCKVYRKTIHAS